MTQPINFPARIYQILENESSEIVQWNSNGLSFRIVNHIRFESEIIPKYFRHRKLSSVQRQLNVYGFRSISRGEHKRSFYHPLFKRGNWEIVKQMARYVPTKGGQQPPELDPNYVETAVPSTEETLNRSNTNQQYRGVFEKPIPQFSSPARPNSVNGALQVSLDDDTTADNHFANDFYAKFNVGTEATNVTIQPVDYSIPIHFQGHASLNVDSADNGKSETSQQPVLDWSATEASSIDWSDLLFDTDVEGLGMALQQDWDDNDSTEAANNAAIQSLHKQGVPTPMQTGGNVQETSWMGQSTCSQTLQGGGGGVEEDDVADWAVGSMKFRSDSMDELYALCADLV
mmetsp:Transcript_117422/g.230422  ORF Transcript_117422/g.230422 Transcript_117422/m.230422 type:complete len:344 (+) Transcript_117422:138-1169(+)|eukprot:CAMPEP_0170400086 /NCGR_PEP_ID=MMETSP0117_2-20130122/24311_1 /TAXON_ID=400756 /ORGANISM="Durinskia baltica, Strain CSIRO CS-38" /LENGTH=343 /DNA_ID=CAMNT_0010656813 /DNA_START=122 /DNA_END=1153 /DNA_ORIENTATION=-